MRFLFKTTFISNNYKLLYKKLYTADKTINLKDLLHKNDMLSRFMLVWDGINRHKTRDTYDKKEYYGDYVLDNVSDTIAWYETRYLTAEVKFWIVFGSF